MNKLLRTPAQISQAFIEIGIKKIKLPISKLIMLGILAGAFISFAAEASNVAIHSIKSIGVAKALAGALFSTGLMMVIAAGGELFTGNSLIVIACLEGKATWKGLIRNWFFVYIGNFIGALLIVFFIVKSGQFNLSNGLVGGLTIKIAAYKVGLSFGNAFLLGVLCNWIVCLAVWMASATEDMTGKLWAIFFPIWLFVTSGFEHCVANMYYIPAGILAKSNPVWMNAAISLGVSDEKISNLNWLTFFTKNLIPVTLGNIVGGVFFVGFSYWLIYLKNEKHTYTSKGVKEDVG